MGFCKEACFPKLTAIVETLSDQPQKLEKVDLFTEIMLVKINKQ